MLEKVYNKIITSLTMKPPTKNGFAIALLTMAASTAAAFLIGKSKIVC